MQQSILSSYKSSSGLQSKLSERELSASTPTVPEDLRATPPHLSHIKQEPSTESTSHMDYKDTFHLSDSLGLQSVVSTAFITFPLLRFLKDGSNFQKT